MYREIEYWPRATLIDENRYKVHIARFEREEGSKNWMDAIIDSRSRFRIVFTDMKSTLTLTIRKGEDGG